jgi:hypothetical protein
VAHERNFKIRYFRVGVDGELLTDERAHTLLQKIVAKSNRAVDVDGGSIFLSSYQASPLKVKHRAVWRGEMRRLRKDDRVAQGDDGGQLDDVKLNSGWHISENSYFLYVPKIKSLAYFSSMHSVSWSAFQRYLNEFLSEDERMIVAPIPDRRKISEYKKMKDFRKLTIHVAQPDRWDLDSQMPVSEAVSNLMTPFSAELLKIELGVGRKRRGLTGPIKGLIDRALSIAMGDRDRVRVLEVEGYTADGEERMAIDLLEEFVVDVPTYNPLDCPNVDAYAKNAWSLLEDSLEKQMDYIAAIFKEADGEKDDATK